MSASAKQGIGHNPLVSIITPILNGAKYLEPCINSVLNQSYPHIEHIFVDGGSTDGTLTVLAEYQAKYPQKIRFISEPDKGPADAWNKGLSLGRGKIFGWLGSDDIFKPDAIETVVEFFKANLDAYFVFGGCDIINERGEVIRKFPTKDFDLEEAINGNCHVPCPSAFYRREVVEKVGFMNTNIHICDLDYWIRVGKAFQLYRIEKVLSCFRLHKDSITGSEKAYKMFTRERFIVSRQHGGSIFSKTARRYYKFVLIERLRPVLGPVYPFIGKALALLTRRK